MVSFILRALDTGTCLQQGDLFYSAGTRHGNLPPAGWSLLFCGPTQEPALATANTGKKSGDFLEEKNASEWTGRVEISEEEIPGSKRGIYGYILTYSRLERENLKAVCSQQIGLQFLHPQLPTVRT